MKPPPVFTPPWHALILTWAAIGFAVCSLPGCAYGSADRNSMACAALGPATCEVCEQTTDPILAQACPVAPERQCLNVRGGPFSPNATMGLHDLWAFLGGLASGIIAVAA